MVLARWGLVPSWASDLSIGYKLINARSETADSKPSFRSAFRQRRCLVVADGFYEWKKNGAKHKQPFHIHLNDGSVFGFAGLWEHWQSAEGEVVESCTILTTEANALMKDLHDPMPVILGPADYDRWLDLSAKDVAALQALLVPFPDEGMISTAVSSYVSNARNEGPKCLDPAST